MSSEQMALLTLHVQPLSPAGAAAINCGTWDKRDGGDVTTAPIKHRPGGSKTEVIYPSLIKYDALTLERVYNNGSDGIGDNDQQLSSQLLALSGKARATVSEQPLDANLSAFGTPRTWQGMLGDIKLGTVDSDSEAARKWTVQINATTLAN